MNGFKTFFFQSSQIMDPLDESRAPTLQEYFAGDVRVRVKECRLPCGHRGFWIDAEVYDHTSGRWLPMALFREFNLDESLDLLRRAKQYIELVQDGDLTAGKDDPTSTNNVPDWVKNGDFLFPGK